MCVKTTFAEANNLQYQYLYTNTGSRFQQVYHIMLPILEVTCLTNWCFTKYDNVWEKYGYNWPCCQCQLIQKTLWIRCNKVVLKMLMLYRKKRFKFYKSHTYIEEGCGQNATTLIRCHWIRAQSPELVAPWWQNKVTRTAGTATNKALREVKL